MTALSDFIAQLQQNDIAPGIQPIRAQVETFVAALNEIASGGDVVLGGDVIGPSNANTVVKLQNSAIQSGAPTDGQQFIWDSVNARYSLQLGGLLNVQIFNASGTYTPTPGTKSIRVRLWAPGGGGGGAAGVAAQASLAQSAGAGGYSEGFLAGILNASTGAVVLGAAGVGGSTAGTDGTGGGTSTFIMGALSMSCPGGLLGTGDAVTGVTSLALTGAAQSATPTGGYLNLQGGGADPSFRSLNASNFTGTAGASFGGCRTGRGVAGPGAGIAGLQSGSGGSAGASIGATGRAGGNGSLGLCLIEEYA